MKGAFITFEGVEGCGKSTQIAAVQARFEAADHRVLVLREPGGTPVGEAIRDILLDPAHEMAPLGELLLYEAARAQLVHARIAPARASGQTVLCDRFFDSTTAYQGAARGLDPGVVAHLNQLAAGPCVPDRTYLFDLPAADGLERARARGRRDRIEREALAFHEAVRAGFLDIAAAAPERVCVIDARQSIEAVTAAVFTDLQARGLAG